MGEVAGGNEVGEAADVVIDTDLRVLGKAHRASLVALVLALLGSRDARSLDQRRQSS